MLLASFFGLETENRASIPSLCEQTGGTDGALKGRDSENLRRMWKSCAVHLPQFAFLRWRRLLQSLTGNYIWLRRAELGIWAWIPWFHSWNFGLRDGSCEQKVFASLQPSCKCRIQSELSSFQDAPGNKWLIKDFCCSASIWLSVMQVFDFPLLCKYLIVFKYKAVLFSKKKSFH